MKKDTKKIFIYVRYILPVVALIGILAMSFAPSFRFVFDGDDGVDMSLAKLVSNSWEESRNILFGAGERTDASIIFSRTLFSLIIGLSIVFLISFAVSIWSMVVAFKCFLSDDEEVAEKWRTTFCVFVPNRIVLCVLTSLGFLITLLPYFMPPLYSWTYSYSVRVALTAPDAIIVGGVLVLCAVIFSIVSARFEREFDADIFKKDSKKSEEDYDDIDEDDSEEKINVDSEQKEYIRKLFEKDREDKK